jgi:hypothetical protein
MSDLAIGPLDESFHVGRVANERSSLGKAKEGGGVEGLARQELG